MSEPVSTEAAISLDDLGKDLEASDKATAQANFAKAEEHRKVLVAQAEGRVATGPSPSMQSEPVSALRETSTGNRPSVHTPGKDGIRVIGAGDFDILDPSQIECPFIEYRIYRCKDCGHWIHAGGADYKQFAACTAEKCRVGSTPEGKRIPGQMELMLWRKPRPGYENNPQVRAFLAEQAR